MSHLMPRQPVPELLVPRVGGGLFNLAASRPEHFTLLVFYRGLHCPVCKGYTAELARLCDEFRSKGVEPVLLSCDDQARAEQAQSEWHLGDVTLTYELGLGQARDWGLYISSGRGTTSIGIEEPAQFSEPGLFLVRPDGSLYWGQVQSMPFGRPHFKDVLGALDFVIANDYPARGEVPD